MATKKPNNEAVGSKAQGFGHQPKPAPQPLPESEWAFHKVKESELRLCAVWELARLQGAKRKPWLDLTEEEKAKFASASEWGLFDAQDAVANPALNLPLTLCEQDESILQPVTFYINPRASDAVLLKDFRRWLRTSPQRMRRLKRPKPTKNRWRSLLARIVILRAADAGLTRNAAIERTSALWSAWTTKGVQEGLTSAPHWSRALGQAKALRKRRPDKSHLDVDRFLFRWAFEEAANAAKAPSQTPS